MNANSATKSSVRPIIYTVYTVLYKPQPGVMNANSATKSSTVVYS